MTPLSACVQAGHGSAYITLESRQPEQWNLKEAPSYWHLRVFSTKRRSMKFLTIQFRFHEVSEPNTTPGVILSAGTQRSPVVWTLCRICAHTLTPVNTTMREDWGLIMTGRCLRYWQVWWRWWLHIKAESELMLADKLLAHHMPTCYSSSYCMPVTSRLARLSQLWHCASPSVSQVIIGPEL